MDADVECYHEIHAIPLLDPVLGDYVSSAPATRDAEVLTLMTEIVSKLRGDILPSVPRILDALLDAAAYAKLVEEA